jgi:hypothetical protein
MTSLKFSIRSSCFVLAAALFGLAAETARADMLPPPRPQPGTAPLVIKRDATQESNRLVIPKKFLPGAGAVKAALEEQPSAALEQRTIHAGVVLSTLIAGGGLAVVFVRRRKTGKAAMTSIVFLAASLLVGTAIADIAVPGKPRAPRPGRPSTQVVVETTDAGDEIVLVLGKNAPKLAE